MPLLSMSATTCTFGPKSNDNAIEKITIKLNNLFILFPYYDNSLSRNLPSKL